jgi:hypothetical protein
VCNQVMSVLEQATMCNNIEPTKKMEKAPQGCKRAKSLSSEIRTTLSTTICNNKVLTKKKKTFQRVRWMESLNNLFAKKCLWWKVHSEGRTTLNATMCSSRKLTKTKKTIKDIEERKACATCEKGSFCA